MGHQETAENVNEGEKRHENADLALTKIELNQPKSQDWSKIVELQIGHKSSCCTKKVVRIFEHTKYCD